MKKEVDFVVNNQAEFLKYLKSKFTMIHMSNFFFRDFHYGVMGYLKDHGMSVKYNHAEKIAREVGAAFEKNGIFKRIDHQSWLVNYPEFALPRVEKKAS
ncbi:MAG: hypothetical protein HY707_01135 [Ignavibacteriae bacterium]|nr:hypothetical protein [Ignavibacteriota bacterium]